MSEKISCLQLYQAGGYYAGVQSAGGTKLRPPIGKPESKYMGPCRYEEPGDTIPNVQCVEKLTIITMCTLYLDMLSCRGAPAGDTSTGTAHIMHRFPPRTAPGRGYVN